MYTIERTHIYCLRELGTTRGGVPPEVGYDQSWGTKPVVNCCGEGTETELN